MKEKLIYFTLFIQILFSETYKDRIRIYIDNSVKNFSIDDSGALSNNDELNRFFFDHNVNKIEQWLPNARPTDRDGDIYLNRYYIVHFGFDVKSIWEIEDNLSKMSCIDHVESVTVNRPTYTPNDPYWNNQYGLELIQADLAYDLWDIDGGEVPGEMESGEIVVGIVDNSLE